MRPARQVGVELTFCCSAGDAAEDRAGGGPAALPDWFPIVHAISPRVLVIEPPADASAADAAALPGVGRVSRSGLGPEILDELEALFVQARSKRKVDSKRNDAVQVELRRRRFRAAGCTTRTRGRLSAVRLVASRFDRHLPNRARRLRGRGERRLCAFCGSEDARLCRRETRRGR